MAVEFIAEKGEFKDGVLYCKKEGACFYQQQAIAPEHKYVVTELTNLEDVSVVINFAFWCGGEQPELLIKCGLFPGVKTQIAMPLEYIDGHQLFIPPEGVRMKSLIVGLRANRDEVTRVGLTTEPHFKDVKLKIDSFHLAGDYSFEPQPEIKIVDDLGQWKQRDWPGKTNSINDLAVKLKAELTEAESFQGFDYGEPAEFDATGYFRVEKVGERFCLVTPDGKPFFSSGMDCVRNDEPGRTNGIEQYFDYLPKDDPELYFDVSTHGFPPVPCVFFVRSNFKRIFGNAWRDNWNRYIDYKIRSWGFNTIAAWSDEAFIKSSSIPYTAFLADYPTTKETVYRDFPDVFSTEYAENAKIYAKQLEKYKDDRQLIGYFMSNEPNFAFVGGLNIAEELLKNPKRLTSKDCLITYYKERYNGDIKVLNETWKTDFSSFDDLLNCNSKTQFSPEALSELEDFSKEMLCQYIKIPALALKEVDSNHLNLGIRWAWISTPALYAGSEYVDVFSINCYAYSCCDDVNMVYENTGKPVIVGEYHFGSTDRGLPATGIKSGRDQQQRAVAIRYYLENAIANPYCVGVHYFQLYDQCILGRPDGEDYQIGVLDICSMEHREVADTFRDIHSKMYGLLLGQETPTNIESDKVQAVFY